MTTLDLTPAPGAAPFGRMVLAQAGAEIRAMLRNGEQLLLTLVIPVLLLTGFSLAPLIDVGGGRRADFLVPGVLALAVMSTAFTGQAIATGFERRYGVLKRLGATPLSRSGLMLAKTTAVVGVEVVQAVIIVAVGLALGWRPQGSFLAAALLIVPRGLIGLFFAGCQEDRFEVADEFDG
ncbi:ABC transporter permease, partial [Nonomuraea fuscirosea]